MTARIAFYEAAATGIVWKCVGCGAVLELRAPGSEGVPLSRCAECRRKARAKAL